MEQKKRIKLENGLIGVLGLLSAILFIASFIPQFPLEKYEISGKKGQKMRMNINHVKKAGITVEEYKIHEKKNPEIEKEMNRISEEWLPSYYVYSTSVPTPEMFYAIVSISESIGNDGLCEIISQKF